MGSTTPPIERIKRRARVDIRDGRPWIIYPDEINGTNVIVEMPNNAPTKSCDQISERIGHANVGFFLQTYAHVLRNDDREAAEQAAAFLIGNGWDPADEGDS